jgi:lysophospholipase L1-like esterase
MPVASVQFADMNRILAAILFLLTASPCIADADFPLAPAVECSPRGGLPNVLAKLKTQGAEVHIAYLGGSITAQEGWRPKTLAYFQKTYPDAKITQINAAIGGTGSDLGVFRLKHDVLDHQPDLMFVEFAVNDAGQPPDRIFRCMEGIVRQTWKAYPKCDICFVYTLAEGFVPTLADGKFPRSASAMEKIAEHYGIPSIHMGLKVAELAKEGKLIFKAPLPTTDDEKKAVGDKIVFSPDGVHPYPQTGHELYLQSILRSLPAIETASVASGAHALPAPFVADNYENAKMIPIDMATLSSGFVKLDPRTDKIAKQFGSRMPGLYKANQPGQTITFRFKGRYAAIYDIIGPDCGQVSVTLDDHKPVLRVRFDAFCTYSRLQTMPIGSDLPDAIHAVKIELDKDRPDKVKILAQRKETMDDPKRYNDIAFYPGAILLVGDLAGE